LLRREHLQQAGGLAHGDLLVTRRVRAALLVVACALVALAPVARVDAQDAEAPGDEVADAVADGGMDAPADAAPTAPRGWPASVMTRASAPPEDRAAPAPEDTAPAATPATGADETAPGGTRAVASADPYATGADGFTFGSYGRVIAASDLRGRTGREADLTAYNPRLDEGVYGELELRHRWHIDGMDTLVVATIGINGPIFHQDAEFDEAIAVRNFFAEVNHVFTRGLAFWAGSRMVRGDDVYLLNFWPLDNLNLVGGGARYAIGEHVEVAAHAGFTQPNDPFYRQATQAPARMGIATTTVFTLDRPRLVVAEKLTYWPFGRMRDRGLKAILYAEQHALPSGVREDVAGNPEALRRENGFVIGGQIGGWFAPLHAFVNVFARHATGLAAFNPLDAPFRSGGTTISTAAASETMLALSANWEWSLLGVQAGAFYRRYTDPTATALSGGQVAEGVLTLRPHVWFGKYAGLAIEGAYQALETTSLDETTGQLRGGSAWKLGVLPFISPFGRGTYTRPHIRVIYALTARDARSRGLYALGDPGATQQTEHFLGIGVEWWFNSSYL
jgi:maltoporin